MSRHLRAFAILPNTSEDQGLARNYQDLLNRQIQSFDHFHDKARQLLAHEGNEVDLGAPAVT